MTIIPGIDIRIVGVDYDSLFDNLLNETFDDPSVRHNLEPLWHIIDVFIDEQARAKGVIYCDVEEVYMAIEDFCVKQQFQDIPALYKNLFYARKGFFTQAKFPISIRKAWTKRFPKHIPKRDLTRDPLVKEFKEFLEEEKELYGSVLIALEDFGFDPPFRHKDDEIQVV